ncbi:MAG: uroporphyrinogen-III synthase [Candidatus Latescibacterota bacterium]|jgi:uroporphyrinogen-III synthase
MEHLLSTKTLNLEQKQLILDANMEFSEYDAISITPISFKLAKIIKNGIFSSQNAIKSVDTYQKKLLFGNIENCFCVGDKTASLLKENGQYVVKIAKNASELAHFINKSYENEDFYFFCGSNRRDELPESIKNSKNRLFEVITYKIELNAIIFNQKLHKILFFSPSGVQSFISENGVNGALAVCIGETTASEARKHTSNVIISNETTVESVIEKAIELKSNLSPSNIIEK